MRAKHPRTAAKLRAPNKKSKVQRRPKTAASARLHPPEITGVALKKERLSRNQVGSPAAAPGPVADNGSRPAKTGFQHPKTELEAAIQRYIDLFDFSPIAYVTFDRMGRIEEISVTAARLLNRSRPQLVGGPFSVCVAPADTQIFLNHLSRCRSSSERVETELRLKTGDGRIFPVQLSSRPMDSFMKDGALLYQTGIIDLTERKKGEAELRQSQERYRTLFELVPIAVYACDADGVIQECNERAAELWGRRPNDNGAKQKFCGSHKIYYPDGQLMPHDKCPMARALRGEHLDPKDLEIVVEREDGERRSIIVAPRPLIDERGDIIGAINCLYDITERKRWEHSLAEAARQQHALYEFMQRRREAESVRDVCAAAVDAVMSAVVCDRASILLFDAGRRLRFVAWRGLSAHFRKMIEEYLPWQRTAKNPKPTCVADVDFADIPQPLKKAAHGEGIQAGAFVPLISDGKLVGRLTIYYNAPHVFTGNEIRLSMTIASRLALAIEAKKAEAALRESEELHRAIVSQTAVGIVHNDLKARIRYANATICQMLGYAESELIGKSIFDLTHPEDLVESKRLFRRIVRQSEPYQLEKRYLRKNGSGLWVNVSASPIRKADGKIEATVSVILDVTERKRAQQAVEEAKADLELRVTERTAALLAANKELLNEIVLRKQLEREILEISDREQRRLGQDLHDSLCQHLTAIAFMAGEIGSRMRARKQVRPDELKTISKLINEGVTEARTIARGLHPVEMDPAGFTAAIRSLLHRQSALPYRLDMPEEVPIDNPEVATHLYRIAREAVINANKHARAREIIVRMRSSRDQIELSVADDGIGISQKAGDGKGMGFHIMNYRARSIGARLEIEPAKPRGTRVSCYVPRK